jgi:hypothetical protein
VEFSRATGLHTAFREESRTSLLSASAALQEILVEKDVFVVFSQRKPRLAVFMRHSNCETALWTYGSGARGKSRNPILSFTRTGSGQYNDGKQQAVKKPVWSLFSEGGGFFNGTGVFAWAYPEG